MIFDVVYSFFDDKITHKLQIAVEKEKIISRKHKMTKIDRINMIIYIWKIIQNIMVMYISKSTIKLGVI